MGTVLSQWLLTLPGMAVYYLTPASLSSTVSTTQLLSYLVSVLAAS